MTAASKPCSEPIIQNAWAGRLIVLEGMPGAGKDHRGRRARRTRQRRHRRIHR